MPVTLVCKHCSTEFCVDRYRQATALYCSNACRGAGLRKPQETALCEQCGTPFIVERGARLCSTPCRRLSQSAKNMGKSLRNFWERFQVCGHEWPCPYCCAIWTGGLYATGYGEIVVNKQRLLVHRVAWALWNERSIPAGFVVAHWCHNPPCCNPWHIRACSQFENIQDSVRDGRHNHGETNGHSKFINVTALEARKLYASGSTIQSIADRFHVSFATAQSLCLRETWKHLPSFSRPRQQPL